MASIKQPATEEHTASLGPPAQPPAQEAHAPATKSGAGSEWEARFAIAMGENKTWLAEHETALLQAHPDWLGKDVVIASCTPSKVLAVANDRQTALTQGMMSGELLEVARQEQVPPGILLTAVVLGDGY
jgi:hypothetical protein